MRSFQFFMSSFEIAFIATVLCFFLGRVSGLMLFTKIPAEYQAGFQSIMNPFGRNGFIQVGIVLLVMAVLVRLTPLSMLYLGITQVLLISIILAIRQLQTHKILTTIALPQSYTIWFWASRTLTIISFLSFFLLLILFLSPSN